MLAKGLIQLILWHMRHGAFVQGSNFSHKPNNTFMSLSFILCRIVVASESLGLICDLNSADRCFTAPKNRGTPAGDQSNQTFEH